MRSPPAASAWQGRTRSARSTCAAETTCHALAAEVGIGSPRAKRQYLRLFRPQLSPRATRPVPSSSFVLDLQRISRSCCIRAFQLRASHRAVLHHPSSLPEHAPHSGAPPAISFATVTTSFENASPPACPARTPYAVHIGLNAGCIIRSGIEQRRRRRRSQHRNVLPCAYRGVSASVPSPRRSPPRSSAPSDWIQPAPGACLIHLATSSSTSEPNRSCCTSTSVRSLPRSTCESCRDSVRRQQRRPAYAVLPESCRILPAGQHQTAVSCPPVHTGNPVTLITLIVAPRRRAPRRTAAGSQPSRFAQRGSLRLRRRTRVRRHLKATPQSTGYEAPRHLVLRS